MAYTSLKFKGVKMGLDGVSKKTQKKGGYGGDVHLGAMDRKDEIKKYKQETVLKPTIFGIDSKGEMEHNFPCPVCADAPATYEMIGAKHVFAPCDKCKKEGYQLIKKNWFWQ